LKSFFSINSAFLLLILLSTLLIFSGTDYMSLKGCDEAYYTQISREMFLKDNWLVTTYDFSPVFEKPPFLFWNQIISFKAFGIGDFQARLPVFIYGIITVILTGFLLWLETGKIESAFIAASVVLTSVIFLQLAHQVMMDIPVLCFLALILVAVSLLKRNPAYGILIGPGFALILLTKGALAFLLLFCILPFMLRKKVKIDRYLLIGLVIGLIPVFFWYGSMSGLYGKRFWEIHFWQQVVQRAKTEMFPNNPLGPFHYLVNMTWLFLPWTFLLFPFFINSWKKAKVIDLAFLANSFFILYFLAIHLMKTWLNHYTLPLLLPVAVMSGLWASQEHEDRKQKIFKMISFTLYGLLAFLLVIAILLVYLGTITLDATIPKTIFVPVSILALTFAFTAFSGWKNVSRQGNNLIICLIIIFGTSLSYLVTEFVVHPWNSEPEIKRIMELLPAGETLHFVSSPSDYESCFYYTLKHYRQDKLDRLIPEKLPAAGQGWYYGLNYFINPGEKDKLVFEQNQWRLIKRN
jgi:4-amino-4-deoxy-L-arabinose transferase-like glycosyltransferase